MKALRIVALAGLVFAALSVTPAAAQYPERNITVIVPFPAGGASDMTARLVTPKLSETLKQSVIVDNRGGANGAIGATAMAQARSPTATRCWSARSACSPSIRPCSRTSNTIRRRISICISLLVRTPNVLVASKDFPANNVARADRRI